MRFGSRSNVSKPPHRGHFICRLHRFSGVVTSLHWATLLQLQRTKMQLWFSVRTTRFIRAVARVSPQDSAPLPVPRDHQ
jgi:hypothetical protein